MIRSHALCPRWLLHLPGPPSHLFNTILCPASKMLEMAWSCDGMQICSHPLSTPAPHSQKPILPNYHVLDSERLFVSGCPTQTGGERESSRRILPHLPPENFPSHARHRGPRAALCLTHLQVIPRDPFWACVSLRKFACEADSFWLFTCLSV